MKRLLILASTRMSMCDSTRLDAIELILINSSNYQTCHDCSVMLLRRPGEQDYATHTNTSLRDASRACNSLLGTYGRRQADGEMIPAGKSDSGFPTSHVHITGQQRHMPKWRRVWASLCSDVKVRGLRGVCEGVNTSELHFDSSQQWWCSI